MWPALGQWEWPGRVIFLFTFSCSHLTVHPDDSGLQHGSKLVSQEVSVSYLWLRHQSWLCQETSQHWTRNEQSKMGFRFSEAEERNVLWL